MTSQQQPIDDNRHDEGEECPHEGILWITFTFGPSKGPLISYGIAVAWDTFQAIKNKTFNESDVPRLRKDVGKAIKYALSTMPEVDVLLRTNDMIQISVALKCSVCNEPLFVNSCTEYSVLELLDIAEKNMDELEDTMVHCVAIEFTKAFLEHCGENDFRPEIPTDAAISLAIYSPNQTKDADNIKGLQACYVNKAGTIICLN